MRLTFLGSRVCSLTTGADTLIGQGEGDVFTATDDTINDGDIIVDTATGDGDTLSITVTEFVALADTTSDTIVGVENVNVAFNSFANSTFEADGISDSATISISQVRDGSTATMTVNDVVDGTTVVAGSGVDSLTVNTAVDDSSLTVNGQDAVTLASGTVTGTGNVTVTANSAATVTAVAATGTATVNSTGGTTINATGATTVVDAAGATTINLVGVGTADVSTIGSDGATTVVQAGNVVETLTLQGSSDVATFTATGALGTSTTLAGDFAVTLAADDAILNGETIVARAEDTIQVGDGDGAGDIGANVDMSGISLVANLVLDDVMSTAVDLQVQTGEIVTINRDISDVLTIDLDDNTDTNITDGTVTVILNADLDNGVGGAALTVDNGGNDNASTMTVTANVDQSDLLLTADTTIVVTLGGSGDVVLNDTGTFEALDASDLTGSLTATAAANHISVTSGSGNDQITAAAAAAVVAAGSGTDTVILGNVAYTETLDGGEGTDTLQLTANAGLSTVTSATLSGFEIFDLQGEVLALDDTQISGSNNTVLGTNAAADDDAIVIQDIDTTTIDLSNLQLNLVDFVSVNASNADYTSANANFAGNGADPTLAGTGIMAAALDTGVLGTGVGFTITGSSTDDIIVTGNGGDTIVTGAGDDEVSAGNGNDVITTGTGDDYVVAGTGNETIDLGAGADYVNAGSGTAVIDLGAADTDADIIEIDEMDNDNLHIISSYEQGTDTIRIDEVLVNGGSTGAIEDGVVAGEFQSAAVAGAYTVAANEVVLEFNFEFDSDVDLDNSGAGASKADILSALGAADDDTADSVTAATLTFTAAGDEALAIFYQGGNAFLYEVTSGADADITTADADDLVELVVIFNNVDEGVLAAGDFVA